MLVVGDLSRQEFDHGEPTGIYSWVKNNYGSSYWKPRDTEAEAAWVSCCIHVIKASLKRQADLMKIFSFIKKKRISAKE
ncbi:MAG: hypothetical protein IPM96_21580 [Ignavibacteria bacterium]|nr:hypothetical protein [Ignavibacteria bacterium]